MADVEMWSGSPREQEFHLGVVNHDGAVKVHRREFNVNTVGDEGAVQSAKYECYLCIDRQEFIVDALATDRTTVLVHHPLQ